MSAALPDTVPAVTLQRPVVAILGGLLLVVALITTSPIAYWLLYALVVVILLSYLWTRHVVRHVRIQRRLRNKWATVGDVLEEQFELENLSRLPVLVVEIDDHSEVPGYHASVAESLGSRETKQWRTRGTLARRGMFRLGPADVTVGDPFGLFSAEFRYGRENTIVVYPPISVMADVAIPAGSMVGTSRSSIRTHQVTSDAGGIREFQPGDPLKRIHWLSTARRGQLLVKEFDLEPTASLWIALDLEARVQAGFGDESTEEYGVKVVSALAYQLIRDNKSVGFLAMGRERFLIQPAKGLKQLWRILEALAVVQAKGRVPFGEFLSSCAPALGRGVSMVAITPSADPSWVVSLVQLSHRSIYPLVIAVDAASFGGTVSNAALDMAAKGAGIGFVAIQKGVAFTTIRPDTTVMDREARQRASRPMAAATV